MPGTGLAAAAEAFLSLAESCLFDPFGRSRAAPAVLRDMQEQLQAAGRVLTTFAIPHACNNPACANVSGPSEAQLVGGRSCICAGCRTARYCGRVCQRQMWRQHKPVCQALAAAGSETAQCSITPPIAAGWVAVGRVALH